MSRLGRVKTRRAPESSAFLSVPGGWDMAKSRRFSKSKSVCAGWSGKSTSTLRYIDAAVRRNEGKLCFIKRKSKDLVSNCRIFCEKNVSFFEDRERLNKNLWTFFRNTPSFFFFLPAFWKRRPSLRPPCHSLFPHPHSLTRERTRPCASRTQQVRNSCLHPSPSPASH